ncbi:MAG TPA: hypothetical protein VF101_00305 [Gaiellaceae bacterium]
MRRALRGRRLRISLGVVAAVAVAATALTVSLFPAAAGSPPSGPLQITDGAATAAGVYVAGDDLAGPESANADLRRGRQKLPAAASAPLVGGDGPVATPSPDGRLVAYGTWTWTRAIDWSKAFDEQGIATGDPLGTPTLRIHDTHGNRDRALEPGTFGASWRADGALAYARGDPASYRANLPYLANVVVRSSATAEPVPWTQDPDRYRVVGWAGRRLIVARGQEAEAADAEVLDGPGEIRLLASGAAVIGISPDGRQALVAVGTPGDGGVTLSLRGVADSREAARLPLASAQDPVTGRALAWVSGPGSWVGDRVLVSSDAGVVVLRVLAASIEVEQVLHVDLERITTGSIYEPRFTDDAARTFVWWADVPVAGVAATAAQFVCDRYALTCKRGSAVAASRAPRPAYDLTGGAR